MSSASNVAEGRRHELNKDLATRLHGFTIHRSIYSDLEESSEAEYNHEDDRYIQPQVIIPTDGGSQESQFDDRQNVDMETHTDEVGAQSQQVFTGDTGLETHAPTWLSVYM